MDRLCKDCILHRGGFCFTEDKPEKITGTITKCDYYLFSSYVEQYKDGFIHGFCYCNKMKKEPAINKIEARIRKELERPK